MSNKVSKKGIGFPLVNAWILSGLLVSVFFWVPLVDAFNVSKFSLLIVLGFVSAPIVVTNVPRLFRTNWKTYLLFLCFSISLFLNLLTSTNRHFTLFGAPGRFAGVLMYMSLMVIAIGLFQTFKEKNFIFLVWTLVTLGAFQTLYSLLQVFDLDPISWNNPYGLIIGTVGNADFAGALIGICGVATLWLVYFSDIKKTHRLSFAILVILEIYLVNRANIRQALIIFFIGIVIFTLWIVWIKNRKFLAPLIFVSLISLGLIGAGTFQVGPLTSLVYKLSISMRGDYWRAAFRMFLENPLIGVGLGNFGDKFPMYRDSIQVSRRGPNYVADAAHNVFLDYLSMGGIFLFLSYLSLLALGFWRLFSGFRSLSIYSQNIRIGFAAIWISYLAQSSISLDQIGLAIWGWIFIGCALSFGKNSGSYVSQKKMPVQAVASLAVLFGVIAILIVAPTWRADLSLKKAMIIGTQNRTVEAGVARLQLLKESTSKDSQNSWYFQNAALILLQSGQIEGIDFAKKALELNPNDILSAKLISMVSADIGQKEQSEKYARIVRELDPLSNF